MPEPKAYIGLSISDVEYKIYARIVGRDLLLHKILQSINCISLGIVHTDIDRQILDIFKIVSNIQILWFNHDRSSSAPLFDIIIDDGQADIINIFIKNNKVCFGMTQKSKCRLIRSLLPVMSILPVP